MSGRFRPDSRLWNLEKEEATAEIFMTWGSIPGTPSSTSETPRRVRPLSRVALRRDSRHAYSDTSSMSMSRVCASTGTSGTPIGLTANFFRIVSRPQWVLYQYHVDFNPPMESRRLRSALLFQHEELLGSAHSFDGALLFLPHKLHNRVMRKRFLSQNAILLQRLRHCVGSVHWNSFGTTSNSDYDLKQEGGFGKVYWFLVLYMVLRIGHASLTATKNKIKKNLMYKSSWLNINYILPQGKIINHKCDICK